MNAPDSIITRPAFVPGIFPDMAAEHYHRVEGMSASGAKKILQSPQHFRLMRDKPAEPTPAMQFGTAVHCGVLEPDAFALRVACAPKVDKRTKDGKAEWADFVFCNDGKVILSHDDFDRARRCIDAVLAHPSARALLDGAQREVSLFWHDAKYKAPCKARLDIRSLGGITDLKTTQDASPEGFARQAASLGYHIQGAHYFSGAEHVFNATPEFFAFICVESEEPYAVACHMLPSAAILAGAHQMNIAIERYARALEIGRWEGYPPTINALPFPRWALTFDV